MCLALHCVLFSPEGGEGWGEEAASTRGVWTPSPTLPEKEPILRDTVINVLTRRTFKELHRAGGIP